MRFPTLAPAQTPFAHRGLDAQHPGSSVLPNEQVDPASGSLAVVATDLVLPGNAGFDLAVTRVYNSSVFPNYSSGGDTTLDEDSWAGIGWKLHFGRVINPDATGGGETQIERGDGSRHALYHPFNALPIVRTLGCSTRSNETDIATSLLSLSIRQACWRPRTVRPLEGALANAVGW